VEPRLASEPRRAIARRAVIGALVALTVAAASLPAVVLAGWIPADWGAAAIVHPFRRPLVREPDLPFELVRFESGGETLEGWLFRAPHRRGTVVYLHGIGDNRQSGIGVAKHLVPRGYDVVAFDSRAHGRSSGRVCSYGVHERDDVSRALDTLRVTDAILVGHSLGAAVALQAAASDPRVRAVVAASSFSDLTTIVEQRAQRFHLSPRYVTAALARAGQIGGFPVEAASPVAAATTIRVPVLLLHGAADHETPPEHSRRISAALRGPHRLVELPGVGHNEILGRAEAWDEIDSFLDAVAVDVAPAGG
jgi:pimeloyl-ACP methyl ester carboxylesterase